METMVMELFGGIYRNKTVLVTGHTGFKGSWLSLWLTMMGARVIGYALAPPTEPNHYNLLDLDMVSIEGDIRNGQKLCDVLARHKPEIVFHLAAQPLVRYSYSNPIETYQINVIGTLNVYEACRNAESVRAIVSITTDKVYENKECPWGYRESDELGGYDPYSSSKACAEILTASYRNSYFPLSEYGTRHQTLVTTARSGNVIGGGDWGKDRLIPDIMIATAAREPVVIRNPSAVRPWQHVLESLSGYLLLGQKLLAGDHNVAGAWNFGPDTKDAAAVHKVVEDIQIHWKIINYVVHSETSAKLPETSTLMLDTSKANNKLHWHPVWNFSETIGRTANWYQGYYEQKVIKSEDDIQVYLNMAAKKDLCWAGMPNRNIEPFETHLPRTHESSCATV